MKNQIRMQLWKDVYLESLDKTLPRTEADKAVEDFDKAFPDKEDKEVIAQGQRISDSEYIVGPIITDGVENASIKVDGKFYDVYPQTVEYGQ